MGLTLTNLALMFSLSSAPAVPSALQGPDFFTPYFLQEKTEEAKPSSQDLANALYDKMRRKDDILVLFFESYGEKDKGFYVEKNLSREENCLIFHADDQRNGKTAVIKTLRDFSAIDSVTLKKVNGGKVTKEEYVSPDDKDALLLYRRMLEASVGYIDQAEITKHPSVGNFAKYNGFIKDEEFVLSLENLITKTRL